MHTILHANPTLVEHIEKLRDEPATYRPLTCPYCGLAGLWLHGFYDRKADRGGPAGKSLNPNFRPSFSLRKRLWPHLFAPPFGDRAAALA
jgi:hypothetical protein